MDAELIPTYYYRLTEDKVLQRKFHQGTDVVWRDVPKRILGPAVVNQKIAQIPHLIMPDNSMVALLMSHQALEEEYMKLVGEKHDSAKVD